MVRLIKLAMYALCGYVLYELYQGIVLEERSGAAGQEGRGRNRARSRQGQFLTGSEGDGTEAYTEEESGASTRHRVGRGVVG